MFKIISGADKHIVENIANLGKIPKIDAYVTILPIKGSGLSVTRVRIVGLINHED